MPTSVNPVPAGFHTVTPSLTVKRAAEAIEFYKKALGAQELMRMANPDGTIGHAEIKIGDSIIFIADEMPMAGCPQSPQRLGGITGTLYLYVPDVDGAFQRAVAAGGKAMGPVSDMFWGDRHGSFVDPFGHTWSLSTHVRDVSQEELQEGAKKFAAQMAEHAQRKSA
ncbi:MAG: VOC family protein [Acidobacteria bacterium]|nr:VOC family protein [Acidobacteriota bacterium]MBV9479383.1 VOC family protein [Acidobacteriota bacterium]